MKKICAILTGIFLVACFIPAYAGVLSDSQLAGIWAGQFDTDINDDVTASNSAVVSQKNIGVIGSTDGVVSDSDILNSNLASGEGSVNNIGDSAVASQANIAAISGLGAGVSTDNIIVNDNDADVDNLVAVDSGSADLGLDSSTNSGDAGLNSMLSTVSAQQSAVVTQNNIGAIVGAGGVSAGSVTNGNNASVNNGPI